MPKWLLDRSSWFRPTLSLRIVSVCQASAFCGSFRKEFKYIEILDDCTETHYDLVLASSTSIPRTSSSTKLATSSLSLFRRTKRWVQKGLANSLRPSSCIWCSLLLVAWHDETLKGHQCLAKYLANFCSNWNLRTNGINCHQFLAVAMLPTKKIFVEWNL